MAKKWISMEHVISSNTNEEIIKELYVDGSTAQYTKRIQELNRLIAEEEAAKQERRKQREQRTK